MNSTMIIDNKNYEVGNKAMALMLLLYYHLLDEGGITNYQTVYLNHSEFNGFDLLGVEIKEQAHESLDLDEELIRKGAIIYLLCDLNDIVCDNDHDFHQHEQTKKIIEALKEHEKSPIPEIASLLELISVKEPEINYSKYNEILQNIYKKHVHDFFAKKLG